MMSNLGTQISVGVAISSMRRRSLKSGGYPTGDDDNKPEKDEEPNNTDLVLVILFVVIAIAFWIDMFS